MTNEEITELILSELKHAEKTHSWEGNTMERNALILAEEAGEVFRAVLQYLEEGGDVNEIRLELIQCAAMCYRFLKNLPE